VRSSFKFFVAIAIVVAVGALLGGSAGKPSHQRQAQFNTTVPSDRSQLKGDLEQQSSARLRLFNESFPALAGDVVRISSSGIDSEYFSHSSFARRTAPVSVTLYQRPPPA
jgi:hypothetical protein